MGIYEAGKYIEVHPTFLYEFIVTIFIFILLTIIKNKRKYTGQITALYLLIYSFARIIIEALRTDSLMLWNLRISQVLSFVIFILTIIFLIYKSKTKKNNI